MPLCLPVCRRTMTTMRTTVILAAFFPSSVIITVYDLIFVFSTLPDKREYFEIHVHKKCTKLTPDELKVIALMSLVTFQKNSIWSWAQLYCWVKKSKNCHFLFLFCAFWPKWAFLVVKSYQRNKLLAVTFCDDRPGDAKTFN